MESSKLENQATTVPEPCRHTFAISKAGIHPRPYQRYGRGTLPVLIESLPFCEEEKASWLEKKDKAEQIGNNEYAELCAYNAESYDIVINKIAALVSNDTTDESINTTQEVSA